MTDPTFEILTRAAAHHADLTLWLDTPRGADGLTPRQHLAAGNYDRARLLAVTSQSPGLAEPPAWVRQPIAPAFREHAEHRQEAVPTEWDE